MAEPYADSDGCPCLLTPLSSLIRERELGMDRHYAEISLWRCRACNRRWLHYLYELEAFPLSGRWYLGMITDEEAANLTADGGQVLLERLPWYFYGGSYYGGRTGRTTGPIDIS